MDKELRSNALATERLFLISLLLLDVSFGDPWGVAAGVAAVWVIIGGGITGPQSYGGSTGIVLSSFVTDNVGGSPNIFFSVKTFVSKN